MGHDPRIFAAGIIIGQNSAIAGSEQALQIGDAQRGDTYRLALAPLVLAGDLNMDSGLAGGFGDHEPPPSNTSFQSVFDFSGRRSGIFTSTCIRGAKRAAPS
jgi:hypothetical protein